MIQYERVNNYLSELMGSNVTNFKVLLTLGFSFYIKKLSTKFLYSPDSTIWGHSEKWMYEGELCTYLWINIDKDVLDNIENLIKEAKYE